MHKGTCPIETTKAISRFHAAHNACCFSVHPPMPHWIFYDYKTTAILLRNVVTNPAMK